MRILGTRCKCSTLKLKLCYWSCKAAGGLQRSLCCDSTTCFQYLKLLLHQRNPLLFTAHLSTVILAPRSTFSKSITPSGFASLGKVHLPVKSPTPLCPFKKLPPQEMATCRDKGLCYNCDEVYTFVHHCKQRQPFMLSADESDTDPQEHIDADVTLQLTDEDIHSNPIDVAISLSALYGKTSSVS